jgi:energy-converting hydrogenase Eha subunit F
MNYIGICKEGFQKTHSNHEPLHQMTMKFDYAVKHFEELLKEAISKGGVLVEPQKVKRNKWKSKYPAFHVNHGKNFTSHFSTYTKTYSDKDSYWGDSKTWIEKLF